MSIPERIAAVRASLQPSASDVEFLLGEIDRLKDVCEDWGKNYQSWVDGKDAVQARLNAGLAYIEEYTHPDDWGVPCVYVKDLLPILRGPEPIRNSSTDTETNG